MKASNFFLYSIVSLVMVLAFSMHAEAALQNLGVDSLGNRLIYDTALDVTWYDYTKSHDTWQNQIAWAEGLSVTFGGTTFDNWRLPTTVDGIVNEQGYDGTTPGGFNITSSEMGHLYYTELGNAGYYDTSGNPTGCSHINPPYCLTNTGVFQNLQADYYWSGTEYTADTHFNAWYFNTKTGFELTPDLFG